MNEGQSNSQAKARLTAIGLSSFFVTFPQILWAVIGYRSIFFILLDTLLVFIGFILLILALMSPTSFLLERLTVIFRSKGEKSGKSGDASFRPYLALVMIPYVLVSYGIAYTAGYSLPPDKVLAVFFTIPTLSVITLIYLAQKEKQGIMVKPIYYYTVLGVLAFTWTVSFWYGAPRIPTDEFAVDYYSAHIFIGGANPYFPSNTTGVFNYFSSTVQGYPYNIITPYTTGGFVTGLTYPALSFLVFVPVNLLRVYPTATFLPFFTILPLIFFNVYSKSKLKSLSLIPVFLLLLNPSYLEQVSLSYPDILWVIFTTLSVFLYRKPVQSGLMMGIAAAVKQVPWVLIPFLFIFIFRERGKIASSKWFVSLLLTFFAINSLFILENPAYFFGSLSAPELQQLIGIGFGPSQIAFLDILPISKFTFTLMVGAVFAASIVLYAAYYHKLRYAFLAFPIIIFLFNYRVLLNYLIFWPIISLIMPVIIYGRGSTASSEHIQFPKISGTTKKAIVTAVVVILLFTPVFYQFSGYSTVDQMNVSSPHITKIQGNSITGMSVSVLGNSSGYSPGELQVRILPYGPYTNMNGYLWTTTNFTRTSNSTFILNLSPISDAQGINWNGSYRMIVYFGNISGAVNFRIDMGKMQ